MVVQTQLCFLLFGTCLFSFLLLLECRKLEGYDFPVFSTKKCPGNQAEWKKRSSAINCTEQNGYMCLPNENLTDLLEFCYIYPHILVQKDLCLYLDKRFSRVNSYNCRRFTHGCPELHYFSSETYLYQSCIEIENGCFPAEPSCKRQPLRSEHSFDATTLAINLGVSIPICLLCILALSVIGMKFGICKRRSDAVRDDEETQLLLSGYEQREPTDKNKEYPIEEIIFNQWKRDEINFVSTKACEQVEKMIKNRNLVIVAGNSGSGKSAIIQHIALRYRKRDWTVKQVNHVEDIVDEYNSSRFQMHKTKTICVFDNQLKKDSIDEIFNYSWQTYEEELKMYLTTAKLLVACRSHVISNNRVARHLVNQAAVLDINDEKYKLTVTEKCQILAKYGADINLSEEDCNEIVKVERHFPLLCKLYSSREEYKNKPVQFFTKSITVLKEEIIGFKEKDKGKYCALALLFLFNDNLCINDLVKNKDTKKKFKQTLKLCGLPENTPPSEIWNNLYSLKDCFVKMIGDRYHFYHDLVMEVTTYMFGTNHPTETIKYTDIGFLRKRVQLGDCKKDIDPFTIYLSDIYIEILAERLFTELFGNRLIDVVLNHCLKNFKVIETLKKIIQKHPKKLPMLLKKKNLKFKKQIHHIANQIHITKLAFMGLENDLSILFVLIVFGHTDLSHECLDTLKRMHANLSSLLPAVYCNGSMELFRIISKDCSKDSLTNDWGGLSPIHIVSVFHNYEMLQELIRVRVDFMSLNRTGNHWTPLQLAAGNDTQEYRDKNHGEQNEAQRYKTVQLLLNNGADINYCEEDGVSPLYLACQRGHYSTVHLLLSSGADFNLCTEDGVSPLHIACQHGHEHIVKMLLEYEADINEHTKDGASPLLIACENGHFMTVLCLLINRACINLCKKDGTSPLYTACVCGHDNIVQVLLCFNADINSCKNYHGTSPFYIACQNGHDSTVELLLKNGADINLCTVDGTSPLYIACQNGHDSTVQLLLSNGADINSCMKDGASPLYIACQNGHDSTVQHLLSNGADINLCLDDEVSPLLIACHNGHDKIAQILLSNGADINSCMKDGASPLSIACQRRHDSTVQLLQSNGADINLCMEDGASPLYIACQNGHDSTVQLLLSNGADVNLCNINGATPLYKACENGHDSIVQLLLSNGANKCLCLKDGVSPFYVAFHLRHCKIVNILIENGVETNFFCGLEVNHDLKDCSNENKDIVEFLLQKDNILNNMYDPNSFFSLFVSSQVERVTRLIF